MSRVVVTGGGDGWWRVVTAAYVNVAIFEPLLEVRVDAYTEHTKSPTKTTSD